MKNLIKLFILSALIFNVLPSVASANANKRIKRTEHRQHARIRQGVRSGELTKDEARGLRKEQREINQARKESKRDDGVLDREERKALRSKQKDASQHIYEEKHDDATRY